MTARSPRLALVALCSAAPLALTGCGGSTGSEAAGQDASANAYKLASLDQGAYASADQVADYQDKLDQLDDYCRQNENQLTRMVYAAATKLTEQGAPTSGLGFMQAFLSTLSSVTPRGNEDCAVGFALTMSAVRADGGTG